MSKVMLTVEKHSFFGYGCSRLIKKVEAKLRKPVMAPRLKADLNWKLIISNHHPKVHGQLK